MLRVLPSECRMTVRRLELSYPRVLKGFSYFVTQIDLLLAEFLTFDENLSYIFLPL